MILQEMSVKKNSAQLSGKTGQCAELNQFRNNYIFYPFFPCNIGTKENNSKLSSE